MDGSRLIAVIEQRKANDIIRPVTVVHDWMIGDDNGRVILQFGILRAPLVQSNLRWASRAVPINAIYPLVYHLAA